MDTDCSGHWSFASVHLTQASQGNLRCTDLINKCLHQLRGGVLAVLSTQVGAELQGLTHRGLAGVNVKLQAENSSEGAAEGLRDQVGAAAAGTRRLAEDRWAAPLARQLCAYMIAVAAPQLHPIAGNAHINSWGGATCPVWAEVHAAAAAAMYVMPSRHAQ